jgi:hypothetical protein
MCRYIPWPGEHVTGFPAGTSIPTTTTTDDHKKKTFPHLLANTWEKISAQIRATGKTKRLCNGRTKELHIWGRDKAQSVQ